MFVKRKREKGYIHKTKMHHELLTVKIISSCLCKSPGGKRSFWGLFFCSYMLLLVSFIGFLGRILSQVCSTLSGVYFLIPLYSLVLGSLLACALLVVPLSWTSVGHPGSVR